MSHRDRSSGRRRLRRFLLASALAALVVPSSALALVESVTLQNTQLFRGYSTLLSASKNSAQPAARNVSITIGLFKARQQHYYTFMAASTAFTMTSTMSSGTLRLNAVAPKPQSAVVAAALGTYGYGTIHFISTGATTVKTCDGGKIKSRPVRRDSGSMTFSPSRTAADRYTRSAFTGTAGRVEGSPDCPVPPPPTTCQHYTSLSSSTYNATTGASTSVGGTRTNSTSTGTAVNFSYSPPRTAIAPAVSVYHSKQTAVAGSRLTAATDLATGKLDMSGLTGWSGILNFTATSPLGTTGPSTCPRKYRFGKTTGPLRAAIEFVGTITHWGSQYASLQRQ